MKYIRTILILLAAAGFLLLVGCKPKSTAMPAALNDWKRPHFEAGGSNAMVCFAIYGSFTNVPPVSGTMYRTAGLPDGVKLYRHTRAQDGQLPFSTLEILKLLGQKNPQLVARIEQAPECLVFQGEVRDPANLNYLRDCVGLVTFYLEHGGVAVGDVLQFQYFDAATWRKDFFDPETPKVQQHVSILFSAEEQGGGSWYHTRGLLKFGRPDVSLRHVPEPAQAAAIELCQRFIELQAWGGRIPEGQAVRMQSLPDGLVCRHGGSMDDPDFNNMHVALEFAR